MNQWRSTLSVFAAALIALSAVSPADASTFSRVGLDHLVAENETIAVGAVVGARSYWNEAKTFIFTEYRVKVDEILKGSVAAREIIVTIPGGTVGDLTAQIVGAADLVQGRSYVLFLGRADVLGARNVLTVRDHCQGVFDVEMAGDGLRAVSQARRHGLLRDAYGNDAPVGGAEGIPFVDMIRTVRELAGRGRDSFREVK